MKRYRVALVGLVLTGWLSFAAPDVPPARAQGPDGNAWTVQYAIWHGDNPADDQQWGIRTVGATDATGPIGQPASGRRAPSFVPSSGKAVRWTTT